MNRIASMCGVTAVLFVWCDANLRVAGQASSNEAPHIGEGGLPQFVEERGWLKLPATWRLGNTSAVSVDAQGHIWVLHRPRTLPENVRAKAAPPVLEFDSAGTFIQGWGGLAGSRQAGAATAAYEWPENEHGLHVDAKGFVWIVGNAMPQDGQILKFTKAGKFVMQIGKSGQTGGNTTQYLLGASGLCVHPKRNELFVSDGYGNSRVMVYDSETGAFKRMWGAYGRTPVEPPSIAIGQPTSPTSQIPSGVAERLQHFKTVHDIAISNDNLIYVADRGNKRIQVFTVDGKYVAQQFVGLDNPEYQRARSTAFSPDPQQRFLYVAGSPVIYILNRNTLEVLGEFTIGAAQTNPPGHQIAADQRGNIYAPQAAQTGPDGKGGGSTVQKFTFTGFAPRK
jgi:DNA-binding beta-propeller fold protein YncE